MKPDPDRFPTRPTIAAAAIDMDDEIERNAWCAAFGVTEKQLAEAVLVVGRMPAAVRFYLRSRGGPSKRTACAEEAAERALRASLLANDDRSA